MWRGRTLGALAEPSAGSIDAFVRKYDAIGNELWTRQFGSGSAVANGIAVDASGVCVAGFTDGNLPGQGGPHNSRESFVRKYDASGNERWIWRFGDRTSWDEALGIAVDASGIYYVAGSTNGTLPGQTSAGLGDAFVVKLMRGGVVP